MSKAKPASCERHDTSIVATVRPDGPPEVRRLLHCEAQEATITPERCLRCPRLVELALTAEGHIQRVHCRAQTEPGPTKAPLSLPRLTVAGVMQRDVLCVRPDLSVDAAMTMFLESGLAAVPVVDHAGALMGFLRESDLSLAVQAERLPRAGAVVGDVMCPYALALPESTPLTRAAAVMALERQTEVVIVGTRGDIVGMLSASDLLAWLGAADGYITPNAVRIDGVPGIAR